MELRQKINPLALEIGFIMVGYMKRYTVKSVTVISDKLKGRVE